MNDVEKNVTRLSDYQAYPYQLVKASLFFSIHDAHTTLESRLQFEARDVTQPLILDGEALDLQSLSLNGHLLTPEDYSLEGSSLTLHAPPEKFVLEITTQLLPEQNSALSGLYRSNEILCTQCEAQGFRRMSYFPDRPDVLTCFETRIEADKSRYPVLLSNGNLIAHGETGTRHWRQYQDPHPKPSYLFALVAGDLVALCDHYLTLSNQLVSLQLYTERRYSNAVQYALEALKKAMAWDERVYAREYDLDNYVIVAVSDFNMGAMENKGLNIFNSKYILARPDSATDVDYLNIDRVVGHEYFHNWSGNRVTCRDWFQLSLKEGLTVFREQQFIQDILHSDAPLIENAKMLRTRQFSEDAGPLSHPVRPESYEEINNFYTVTIYEKGAEVIRMLQTLLGEQCFAKAMNLYFERFDGQAATIENFLSVMAEVSGRQLEQFMLWYAQAGTPRISWSEHYDPNTLSYRLDIEQITLATPGQSDKQPLHIPIKVALLDDQGQAISSQLQGSEQPASTEFLLELKAASTTYVFTEVKNPPVLSILRDFSAPVILKTARKLEDLAFLIREDTNAYSRWDALQELIRLNFVSMEQAHDKGEPLSILPELTEAYERLLNSTADVRFIALMLTPPSQNEVLHSLLLKDAKLCQTLRLTYLRLLAQKLHQPLLDKYHSLNTNEPYSYNEAHAAQRQLKNTCLQLLAYAAVPSSIELAHAQYHKATNMTDCLAALKAMCVTDHELTERALHDFYQKWQTEPLVVDKWLSLQASSESLGSLARVQALSKHPAFDIRNPNKVYALIHSFAADNLSQFHDPEGHGYTFLSEVISRIDSSNPQVASRLASNFAQTQSLNPKQAELARRKLQDMKAKQKLSKDVSEIIDKCLYTQDSPEPSIISREESRS